MFEVTLRGAIISGAAITYFQQKHCSNVPCTPACLQSNGTHQHSDFSYCIQASVLIVGYISILQNVLFTRSFRAFY